MTLVLFVPFMAHTQLAKTFLQKSFVNLYLILKLDILKCFLFSVSLVFRYPPLPYTLVLHYFFSSVHFTGVPISIILIFFICYILLNKNILYFKFGIRMLENPT